MAAWLFALCFFAADAAWAAPVISFTATPIAIASGGSTTLDWTVTDATSCTASAIPMDLAWSGTRSETGGSEVHTPTVTTTYTLTCTDGVDPDESVDAAVTVGPPVTASVSTDFAAIPLGGSVLVTWSSASATSCTGTGFSTAGATSGSTSVTPGSAGAHDFDLDCTGAGGANANDSASVTVGPAIAASVTSDFAALPLGGSVLLTWSSTDATSCTGTNFSTGGATSGSVSVTPGAQGVIDYDLDCSGDGGATGNDSISVTVGPPITASISSDFSAFPLGGSALLTWSSTDATSCTGTGFATSGSTSGSVIVAPGSEGTHPFDVVCDGAGGASGNASLNITVGPPITATLTGDFAALPLGGSVLLSWSSAQASSCAGTGFETGGATIGSVSVTPGIQGSVQYDLVCSGDGGASGSDNIVVSVGPPITATLTVDFSAVPLGGSVQVTWSSSDANSCTGTNFVTGGATSGSTSITPGAEGLLQLDLDCAGDGGAAGSDATTVTVGPPVGTSVTTDFAALPLGGDVLVTWSSTDANTCAGTNFSTGGATSGSVSVTPSAQGTIDYDLSCTGDGGASGADSTTVTVGAPITASVTPDFAALPLGGSVLLTWSSTDATSCTGTNFSTGGATAGSTSVTPGAAGAVPYDLNCVGNGGATGADSTTVTVGPPITATLTPDFTTLPLGGSVLLTWSSTDATSCLGTGFTTGGATSGSVSVTPGAQGLAVYDLDCSGNGGATGSTSASVTVGLPISVSISSDFATVPLGGNVTIDWSSTDANSCAGTGFGAAGLVSGFAIATPGAEGSVTYTALCTGNGGATGQASVIVTVIPPVSVSLSSDFAAFPLGGSALLTWDSTSANTCTGTGFTTGTLTNGSVIVTPSGQGAAQYDLQCDGNGGASNFTSITLTVGPPITVSLTANPDFIALGGTSSLDWTSTDATRCSGDIFSTGGTTSGSAPVTPVADSTYNVTCTGAGGATGADSATVTVGPPVTTTLSADFELIALGGSSTLTWSSANADTCMASSAEDLAFAGSVAVGGGNQLVSPTVTATYTITCVGPGNAIDASNLTVTVGPPVVVDLSADFTFIAEGGSSLLTWTSSNALTCTGTNFSTGGNTNSSQSVSPIVNTTYTVECVGLGNAIETAQVVVDVGPPVVADLTSDLVFIALGGSAELSWTGSGGATSCTGDGSYSTGGALTGTATVSPATTTLYTLTCDGPGNATDVSTVSVEVGPAPTATLVSNFSAIPLGGTVQLTWSSENATSCSSVDFTTGGNIGGVVDVTPLVQGDIPYTVTCDAPGGATANSVFIVTVGPPVSATIDSDFTFIASGGSADLDWSSTSANTCSGNIFSTSAATSGTLNVAPTSTSTYTVTCVGDGGATGADSVTIVVGPAVVASLTASPTFIALGGTSTLSWVGSGGATHCDDDLQFVTNGALTGTDAVNPSVMTTYTLTCHGEGNAVVTADVTVDVGPPVVVDLTASLAEVAPGGTSTLTWTATGPATSCTGDLFLTGGALNGSTDVVPVVDTIYTVTCLGPGGVVETAQTTVTLGPPVTATLVSDLPSVPLGGTINLTWTSANASSCTSPDFATGGLANGGPVSDTPADTIVYTITCVGAGGGTGSANVSVIVDDAVIATLAASPTSLAQGGSTTLTWSSGGATLGCTGTGFSTGGAESGSAVVSPASTTIYIVQCDGPGGTGASATVQVNVDLPLAAVLDATPTFIASGGSSTINWLSTSATNCIGDIFDTGNNPNGFLAVSPTQDTTYTLTCMRAGSADIQSSATVTVGPPVQTTLTSEFTAIALGGSSLLTWTSENASSCTASSTQDPAGWTGSRAIGGGSLAVSPTETSVYEIDCAGPGGGAAHASVIVTVGLAVTASLTANPMAIALGGTSQLSWASANATSCTGDLFSTGGAVNGNANVSPASEGVHTYTLTCNGAGNVEVIETVDVTVGPAVTASLTADLTFVAVGGTTTLTWSSTDATQCDGDVFATTGATSGSLAVTPAETTTYTLTCTGAGGATENASVTVSVGPAVTATLTASIETIALGGSSTLTWDSANATSCTASSVEDTNWSGTRAISGGTQVVTPSATATYQLDCVGPGGASASDSITVAVGLPVTASLTADFTTIASGGSTTLDWLGTGGATSCSGDIFSTGGTTSGSLLVSPTVDTTYNLTCMGAGGASDEQSLTIVVGPPVTASLTVDIDSIAQGGTSTLTWTGSPNATSCTGSSSEDPSWVGPKSIAGSSQSVSPSVTATYVLRCDGLGNATATSNVVVTVGPPVTATITPDPLFINLGGSSDISWTSTNATSCAGDLFPTGGAASGTASVSPTENTNYIVTCTGPGNAMETDTGTVVVGPAVVATLDASPTFIASGGSTTLSWNGENAITCDGDLFATGGSRSDSLVVAPTETTTYTVTCTGAGNAVETASVTVSVGPAVTASLTAIPTQIAEGGTATLTWTGNGGATACSGHLFSTGGLLSGSADVNPPSDQTYTVTCTGPGGASEAASVTVLVDPPVTASLSASLITIAPGGSTDLTWSSSATATSCTGDLFTTSGLTSGTANVSPAVTTSYTVTCVGGGGASDSASVTVTVGAAVTATLGASEDQIAIGGSSDLTWSSDNATTCTGAGFSTGGNPNGTVTVLPTVTTVYTVTCDGAGGAQATDSVTVSVGSAVTAILSASLETIANGGTTTLTWASGNADTCLASSPQDPAWQGAVDIAGGTMDVSPFVTSTYSLTCTGAGGALDQEDVVVTVGPSVVASLTADPEGIAEGGTSSLSWSGTGGATSCDGDLFATGGTLAGSVDVTPTETTVYTLTCTGLGGATDTDSVTVDVGAPVQAQLSANILAIALGGSSTLSWNSANANECTASSLEDPFWSGLRAPTGGLQTVSPTVDSTYVLDCVGDGDAQVSASVTVTVGSAPTALLTADILAIAPGGSATLTWTGGGGATSCSGTGFPTAGALAGSIVVSPLFDTTYTVTCDAAGGANEQASVTIAVGSSVTATVDADPGTIALGGSSLLTWAASNALSCVATSTQDPSWAGALAVAGGTQVVTPTARSTYEIECTGAGGATSRDGITVQVGPPPIANLSTDLTDIALTGSALLSWNTSNATSCTASSPEDPAWDGPRSIAGGTQPVAPSVTSTYTLSCDGLGGANDTVAVTVNVGPAPTAAMTATPTFINSGGSSTLDWTGAGGATSCSGDLFATGGQLTGSLAVSPTQTTTYTLTCVGDGGAVITANATVNVGPGVGATLTAAPEFIARGGSSTLTWGSGNATSCIATSTQDASWSGSLDVGGGTQVVSPTVNSIYTLTCDGEGGATAETSVTILVGSPVSAILDADLFDIPQGGSVTLDWEGRGGATSCNGDANFSTGGALTGATSVSPAATTPYVLTCVGAGGATAQDTVTINVGPPITATLTASPDSIALGGQSTLSWTSSGGLSCTGVNFDTSGLLTGNVTVAPTSTTTYSIVCDGIGGAQSAQVNESILVGPAVTVTLTATPPAIAAGGTSSLSWTSANANTCSGTGFPTGDAVVGSFDVSPSLSTPYQVVCTGDGGATANAQATVSVGGRLLASLSAEPQTIARFGTTTLSWDGSAAATSCSGIGPGFDTGGAIAGSIDVSPTSNATYTVTCDGLGGVSDDASVNVDVSPPVDATLSTDFPTIALGGSATLTWSSISASDCTASSAEDPGWSGARPITGGIQPVSPTETSTYTLTCNASGGTTDVASVTVTVGAAVSTDITAAPLTIALGGSTSLTWTVTNATSCNGTSSEDTSWNGPRNSLGGTFSVSPSITSTYTLDCLGLGGASASDSVTVNVGPAVTVSLTSDLDFVSLGGSATLTWSSQNADTCTASSGGDATWVGDRDPTGGSQLVTPTQNTTYRLTCVGAGAATTFDVAIISVGSAVQANLFSSVAVIALGGSSTLTWGSSRATSCTAFSGQDPQWSGERDIVGGSQQVTPTQTATYTLNCVGAGGATDSTSVTVTVGSAVVATLDADPNPIAPGGTATLTWTSQNAESCVGDFFPTGGQLNGSIEVTLGDTWTYTLSCLGLGGAQVDVSETVFVGDAVIVSLAADRMIVPAGGTSTLTWASQNAQTCTGTNFDPAGATSGTVDVTLDADAVTYEVDCTGAGGAVESDSLTITIAPPPTADLRGLSPIRLGGSSTLVWNSSGIACTGVGFSTGAGDPRNGTTSVVASVTTTYSIDCIDEYGQSVSDSFELVVLPGPDVTFSSNVASVQTGDSATLTWSVTNASACIALGAWDTSVGGTGTPKDPIGGSETVNPLEDSLYVLRCFDVVGQNDTEPVEVTIAPEIDIFIADPDLVGPGGSSSLIWATNHADSCIATNWSSGGEVGIGPGVFEVTPAATTDYTITCTGPGGPLDIVTVTVEVGNPVDVSLTADRERIGLGQSTTLRWRTDLANSCTASADNDGSFSGPQPVPTGSLTVNPTVDTTYRLDCIGAGGAPGRARVTVTIADPIVVNFSSVDRYVAPPAPPPGGATDLVWSITNDAQSSGFGCTRSADPLSAAWNGADRTLAGTRLVRPEEETTYSLRCVDDFYPAGIQVDVVVGIAPVPVVSLTADQSTIAAGGKVLLSWVANGDADYCEAVDEWAENPLDTTGDTFVEPLETTLYEVQCFNNLQPLPGTDTVTVFVDVDRARFQYIDDPEAPDPAPLSWGEAIEMRSDRIALLGSYEHGLRIVDASIPEAPTELLPAFDPVTCMNDTPFGDETLEFIIEDVALDAADEDIVYISAGPCGVFTVDLNFQGGIPNPVVLSIIDTDGSTEHVEMEGDTAYIADFNGGVLSFDMSDRANPVPLGGVAYDDATFGAALDVDVEGDRAYVASTRGLRVIDTSNPSRLRVIASVDTDVNNGFVPQGIRIWNGLAFVSSWTGGLLVMDVRGAPVLLPDRRVETDHAFYKLAIDETNELLYIAEGPSGIQVVDISGVDSDGRYVTLEQIDIGRFVWDVGLDANGLFASFGVLPNYDGGMQMIIDRPPIPALAERAAP